MIDLQKVRFLKILGYTILLIISIFIGIGIGQSTKKEIKSEKKEVVLVEEEPVLKQEQVNEFLLNYFTKKDLGENRKRYKEYMTETLYQQEVEKENEPSSQTYKGFVVDFEFRSAETYINQNDLSVITQVEYVNTLLDEKKNYDTAQIDVVNQATLRLTYVNEKGQFKVDKIESIILTDQTGDYGILDDISMSEEDSLITEDISQATVENSDEVVSN
ncbi:hypothetical protein SUT380_21230 (plasmid) [Streptococcus parasuis]|nr:hypothetical protein SUT380_21230 [Streptococcus parasuis]